MSNKTGAGDWTFACWPKPRPPERGDHRYWWWAGQQRLRSENPVFASGTTDGNDGLIFAVGKDLTALFEGMRASSDGVPVTISPGRTRDGRPATHPSEWPREIVTGDGVRRFGTETRSGDAYDDSYAYLPQSPIGPSDVRNAAEVLQPMRDLKAITRLITVYPPEWRRWCSAPETGGCACNGCVRQPAPSTVRGDPEGKPFPNPSDRLTEEEVSAYLAWLARSVTGDGT